jgi:hypothetical protein
MVRDTYGYNITSILQTLKHVPMFTRCNRFYISFFHHYIRNKNLKRNVTNI